MLRASAQRLCARAFSFTPAAPLSPVSRLFPELDVLHPRNNVPPSIKAALRGRPLLRTPGHPLATLRDAIVGHFSSPRATGGAPFRAFEAELSPLVSVAANFDELLTPADHVSRRPSDTFYVDDATLLRCHMTAHQTALLRGGHSAFLMVGDVYRRDTVDATHAPVFHQVDGVRVWDGAQLPPAAAAALAAGDRGPAVAFAEADLRAELGGLAAALFGAGAPTRWVPAHFPFTEPSLELEVQFEGKWLELLGCGVVRAGILAACGRGGGVGWAFGMGLERLAMVLHGVPDIRLFWSEDARFLGQFAGAAARAARGASPYAPAPVKFEPFSRYPACYKDLAFWVPAGVAVQGDEDRDAEGRGLAAGAAAVFHENDVHAAVREGAGRWAESVARIDKFAHPKTGRTSLCYRVNYRAADRTLTNAEVDGVHARVVQMVKALGVELR
jgi:phenylalanyl-tRNA synthetase alpha chain